MRESKRRKKRFEVQSKVMPVLLLFFIFSIIVLSILSLGNTKNDDNLEGELSPSPTKPIGSSDEPIQKPSETVKNPTEQIKNPAETETTPTKSLIKPTGTVDDTFITTRATKILDSMTLEEKVGQMFFVRVSPSEAQSDLKKFHIGGFILFAVDFEHKNKEEVIKQIASYQELSKIPLLIGVDEEGGTVNRVSKFKEFRDTPFLSPHELYAAGGFSYIQKDTEEKSKLLKELGINVNLAPVSDISSNKDDYIYPRTLGLGVEKTAEYVKTVVTVMNQSNLGSVLKHFPGYGNNVNTHTGISIDNRSYEDFLKEDFLPFKAGIDAGADSILVSHNIVNSMDKDLPASLSSKVHTILRKELKFDGVVMTDDLYMEAITDYTDGKAAAILAVKAGNDMLIASDYKVQIPTVIEAVKSGEISMEMLEESVLRILKWKLNLGIMK